jgi:hypothetical protein
VVPPVPLASRSAAVAGQPPILTGLRDGRNGGDGGEHSDLTRVLTAVAAVAVLAAIVIVLLSVTSGGGSKSPATSSSPGPVSNAPKPHHPAAKTVAVIDSSVTVAVLNGTAVYHAAQDIATQLNNAGFKQGMVTNAANQTQTTTTVSYLPNDQHDAQAVAQTLKLGASAVRPINSVTQALACPQTTSCNADVVVTVGSDLASALAQTSP